MTSLTSGFVPRLWFRKQCSEWGIHFHSETEFEEAYLGHVQALRDNEDAEARECAKRGARAILFSIMVWVLLFSMGWFAAHLFDPFPPPSFSSIAPADPAAVATYE